MTRGGAVSNLDRDDGYTRIPNIVLERLALYRLSGEAWKCLLVIFRKLFGWHKKSDCIPLSQFVELTGMGKQSVVRALKYLSERKIIAVSKNAYRGMLEYRFNQHFHEWGPVSKKDYRKQNCLRPVSQNADNRVSQNAELIRKERNSSKETSADAGTLTEIFLSTLSPQLHEKVKKQSEAWKCCFDILLKEFDFNRLKDMILFYRHDDFWSGNFLSPLKLLRKNKEGIRWIDYFFERMKSGGSNGRNRSSLQVGSQREETEPRDPAADFLARFPEDLQPLRPDFEAHYESGNGGAELAEKLLAHFAGNAEYESKVSHFLENLAPQLRTREIERTYRLNHIKGKFGIPEFSK